MNLSKTNKVYDIDYSSDNEEFKKLEKKIKLHEKNIKKKKLSTEEQSDLSVTTMDHEQPGSKIKSLETKNELNELNESSNELFDEQPDLPCLKEQVRDTGTASLQNIDKFIEYVHKNINQTKKIDSSDDKNKYLYCFTKTIINHIQKN